MSSLTALLSTNWSPVAIRPMEMEGAPPALPGGGFLNQAEQGFIRPEGLGRKDEYSSMALQVSSEDNLIRPEPHPECSFWGAVLSSDAHIDDSVGPKFPAGQRWRRLRRLPCRCRSRPKLPVAHETFAGINGGAVNLGGTFNLHILLDEGRLLRPEPPKFPIP